MRGVRAFVVAIVLGLGASSALAEEPVPTEMYTQPSKPSGFWGSGRPTTNAKAYRWRLLAIGGVLVGGTGLFMIRLVRRTDPGKRQRNS
jgi:hypothetical protein